MDCKSSGGNSLLKYANVNLGGAIGVFSESQGGVASPELSDMMDKAELSQGFYSRILLKRDRKMKKKSR